MSARVLAIAVPVVIIINASSTTKILVFICSSFVVWCPSANGISLTNAAFLNH
jgi:hypothetical protein